MNQDGMCYEVTQEYEYLNRERRTLMQERDRIDAKLDVIEVILTDLNDILCKHGNHIYEHFVEAEPQTESEPQKRNCDPQKGDCEPQERSDKE